jgi:hypothetical protein
MNRRSLATILITGMLAGCVGPRDTAAPGKDAGIAAQPWVPPVHRQRMGFGIKEWFWMPIEQHEPLPGDARLLADDPTGDRRSRCMAIFSAFADYVRPGCTSGEIARLLGPAPWMDEAEISRVGGGGGGWPILPGFDETMFSVRLFPKDEAWGDMWEIYVILSRPAAPEDPCCPDVEPRAFLRGAVTDNRVQIREFMLCHPFGVLKTFPRGWIGMLHSPAEYLSASTLLDMHYGYLYLHIPDNEEWPESQWPPEARVSTNRYSKITRVSHVGQEQFEQDLQQGKMLFQEKHGGAQFYATERILDGSGDRTSTGKTLVLERKAYP